MAAEIVFQTALHRYTPSQAVGPVTFSVAAGEVVGLVGSNGSGKTTAMKMALGLLRLHEGSISVAGQPVEYGRLPQDMSGLVDRPYFYEQLSGTDNLVLAAAGRVARRRRIDPLLAEVGLTPGDRKKVRDYSQGMKQRLGIARTLLGDPRYVLLDEPTNGLDPDGIRWVRGLVDTLTTAGKAVVVSSHLLGELQRISRTIVIMRAGQVVDVRSTADLVAQGLDLEDLYLGTASS